MSTGVRILPRDTAGYMREKWPHDLPPTRWRRYRMPGSNTDTA